MPNEPPDLTEKSALRALMESFIEERLMPKLEKEDKALESETDAGKKQTIEAKRQQLIDEYQREIWIENAAKRVSQIQLVTHAIKYVHPGAKGSNVHAGNLGPLSDETLVGTHTLQGNLTDDVVGNAAALDVFKFLNLEHQGQTILKRVMDRDEDLMAALSDDETQSAAWVEKFATITGSGQVLASHRLAKQLYFPLPDGGYHLLSPLFPTSLVHTVHMHLREARFSDEVKEARAARKEARAAERGYTEYPNISVQNFGGTKPQNVSQLNSERYGENWLLPSLPPIWVSAEVRPPLQISTVFGRWFGNRHRVRELTKVLARFLVATDYNNVKIRRKRAKLVDYLRDEMLQFADELIVVPPGWSAAPECRLNQAEALWLDPGRAETDEGFASQYRQGAWKEDVASRFGNWLNSQLRYHSRLPVGEAEHAEWVSVLKPVLDSIGEELDHG